MDTENLSLSHRESNTFIVLRIAKDVESADGRYTVDSSRVFFLERIIHSSSQKSSIKNRGIRVNDRKLENKTAFACSKLSYF